MWMLRSQRADTPGSGGGSDAVTLVFVGRRHCGASRRMESLVAWIKVTQKKHLRVVELDADRSPELAQRLGVRKTPTLVLLRGGAILRRLEGRATGRQIEELIRPFVGRGPAQAA
jgi:thioredoxin-like negative regulator of GroEL